MDRKDTYLMGSGDLFPDINFDWGIVDYIVIYYCNTTTTYTSLLWHNICISLFIVESSTIYEREDNKKLVDTTAIT